MSPREPRKRDSRPLNEHDAPIRWRRLFSSDDLPRMAVQATSESPEQDIPGRGGSLAPEAVVRHPFSIESLRFDIREYTLALQQLLELGPGENPEALQQVTGLVARLRKKLPESHFREERLRDLLTDFSLWFSRGPRLQFDYNDEALRSMLQVDIHRLNTA